MPRRKSPDGKQEPNFLINPHHHTMKQCAFPFHCLFRNLLILTCLFPLANTHAQRSSDDLQRRARDIRQRDPLVETVLFSENRRTPELITFRTDRPNAHRSDDARTLLSEKLEMRTATDELKTLRTTDLKNEIRLERFQQYFRGVKVAHGQYLALSKAGKLAALTGEFYDFPENFNLSPSLTEQQALDFALKFVGAKQYAWEQVAERRDRAGVTFDQYQAYQKYYFEYLPKGELTLVDDFSTEENDLDLAYRFNIYAAEPLSRAWIFVNAHTGKIMLRDAIIKHSGGDTRYAGNRNFGSETGSCAAGGQFELLNTAKGGGMETRTMQGLGGLPLSIPALYSLSTCLSDNDGNWTEAEHTTPIFVNEVLNNDFALDAHWGAEIVYDYWFKKHGRLSFDDNNAKITSFVHYGVAYDNAFWNGEVMTYGDGSWQQGLNLTGGFAPLTSMDVCGHEIGHAICTFTADLVYEKESGAMNEGFSDIWAACIEKFVLDSVDNSLDFDPWGIGEQIDETDLGVPPGQSGSAALRWMDHPKAEGNPDTYGGTNWTNPNCSPNLANDYCGVHNNSGVLNKWFYLLVSGSGQPFSPGAGKPAADDGVNDLGFVYNFAGVGFAKAEKIAFLTETLLTPTSTFANARTKSLLAAATLYGACSAEQNAVAAAWSAVNVNGTALDCSPRVEFNTPTGSFSEAATSGTGCDAKRLVSIPVFGVSTTATVTVSAVGTGTKPATPGDDFNLLTTTLDFSTGGNKVIEIEILDDGVVETNETLLISLSGFSATFTLTITDDDVNPSIGNSTVTVLATQMFNSTNKPSNWTIQTIGEGGNLWKFNGSGLAAGTAYITAGAVGSAPVYDQTVNTHTILVTPLLDGRGKNSINLSFNWTAGGETDAADPTLLFDYGSVGYSLDGENFTFIQDFVGTAGGAVMASGTFNQNLPAALNNSQFYVGFRWYNDALVGTAHSFTIDNVALNGKLVAIETALDAESATKVGAGQTAYFYSPTGKIIGKVKDLSGSGLGCVNLKITQTGGGRIPLTTGERSEKVFTVSGAGLLPSKNYQLTVYHTGAEVSAWGAEVDELGMVKTTAATWGAAMMANSQLDNTTNNSMLNADNDRAFMGNFSGPGMVALQKDVEFFGCMIPFSQTPVVDVLQDVLVRIEWDDVAGLGPNHLHFIRYRPIGNATWLNKELPYSYARLTSLLPDTDYEYQIANHCDLGQSAWSPVFTFTTSACTFPILSVSDITSTSATISWTSVPLAMRYYLSYKKVGGTNTVLNFVPSILSKTLTNLLPNSTYQYRMRVQCPWGNTLYSPIATFQTAPSAAPNGSEERSEVILETDFDEIETPFWLFPNPASEVLTVGFESPSSGTAVRFSITDQLGRQVFESNWVAEGLPDLQQIQIPIGQFSTGVYWLHFMDGQRRTAQKFVIERN